MTQDYYKILEPGDLIEAGDEYLVLGDRHWTQVKTPGRACLESDWPLRRKLNTGGVDPARAGELWNSLHALLQLFTGLVDQLNVDAETTLIRVTLKSGAAPEMVLEEAFTGCLGVLQDAKPGWARQPEPEEQP